MKTGAGRTADNSKARRDDRFVNALLQRFGVFILNSSRLAKLRAMSGRIFWAGSSRRILVAVACADTVLPSDQGNRHG
jgi:hypothetical protein